MMAAAFLLFRHYGTEYFSFEMCLGVGISTRGVHRGLINLGLWIVGLIVVATMNSESNPLELDRFQNDLTTQRIQNCVGGSKVSFACMCVSLFCLVVIFV